VRVCVCVWCVEDSKRITHGTRRSVGLRGWGGGAFEKDLRDRPVLSAVLTYASVDSSNFENYSAAVRTTGAHVGPTGGGAVGVYTYEISKVRRNRANNEQLTELAARFGYTGNPFRYAHRGLSY